MRDATSKRGHTGHSGTGGIQEHSAGRLFAKGYGQYRTYPAGLGNLPIVHYTDRNSGRVVLSDRGNRFPADEETGLIQIDKLAAQYAARLIRFWESSPGRSGGSVPIDYGTLPDSGYIVSIPYYGFHVDTLCRNQIVRECIQTAIRCFLIETCRIVECGQKLPFGPIVFGLWRDGHSLYFDVNETIDNREKAILTGKARRQLAIWDCANGVEVSCVK